MSAETINKFTNDTAKRYETFCYSIIGLLSKTLDGPDAFKPTARMSFKNNAISLALMFLEVESKAIEQNSTVVLLQAISDIERDTNKLVSESVKTSLINALSETVSDTNATINDQADRDLRTVIKRVRDMIIRASMLESQRGWSATASLLAVRESEKKSISFEYRDKIGRKWGSERYVRSLIRSHYISTYNEAYMFALSKLGINMAKLVSQDELKLEVEFRIFDLDSRSNTPTYQDLIDARAIHPNSSYLVSHN